MKLFQTSKPQPEELSRALDVVERAIMKVKPEAIITARSGLKQEGGLATIEFEVMAKEEREVMQDNYEALLEYRKALIDQLEGVDDLKKTMEKMLDGMG